MEFLSDWNFYGLCAFGLLCIGALVWQRMYYAKLKMEHLMWMRQQDGEQAAQDEAERRRVVHEADSYNEACARMEPFYGEGKKP